MSIKFDNMEAKLMINEVYRLFRGRRKGINMKIFFKGIRKKEQGNKFVTEDIKRHPEGDNPKDLQTLGSRFFALHARTKRIRLRLTSSARVAQNDEENKILKQSWIIGGSAGSTQPSPGRASLLPKSAVQDDNTAIVQNDVINKSVKTLVPECPSIPFLTNLFPYFPISFSLRKKLRRFRIKSGMTFIKRPAFTLAEVLITLGIIGIVAAMTIPTLITNNQKKQTVVKLQRAISVLNQAYKLSYDDVGELGAEETKDFNSLEYFNTYWAPYIKISTYCRSSAQCGYKSNTPWKYANWSKSTLYPVEPRLRAAFITADGFLYTIFLATWSSGDDVGGEKKALYKVTIDLNGAEGPNRYGRDVFFLSRTQTDGGGIRPFCYEKSNDEVDKDCSTTGLGECCAEKIRRAGWEIDKTYPWK